MKRKWVVYSFTLLGVLLFSPKENCYAQSVNLDSLWIVWNDINQPDIERVKAINDIAWEGYLYKHPDSAYHFAQYAYDFAKKIRSKKQMAFALNTQGASFWVEGDYEKSIKYFTQSLKIKEEIGDRKDIAASLGNIGAIYQMQGNYSKAIEYYTKVLTAGEKLKDKNLLGNK